MKSNDIDQQANTIIIQSNFNQRINMVDLETALSYMLRREIPRIQEIQHETFDALVHWLNVLVQVH